MVHWRHVSPILLITVQVVSGIQSTFYGGATGGLFSILQSLAMSGSYATFGLVALGGVTGKFAHLILDQEKLKKASIASQIEWHGCMANILFNIIDCYTDDHSSKYCNNQFELAFSSMDKYKNDPVGEFSCP